MGAAFGLVASIGNAKPPSAALAFVPIIGIYVVYLAVFAYVRARVGNLTLNGAIVGPLRSAACCARVTSRGFI